MRLTRGKRRVLLALGSALGLLLVVWFSAPLWFPWVFHAAAAKLDIKYQRLERRGYAHFVVHGIGFTNEDVRVSIGKAEGLVPTVWLWRRLERTGSTTPPFVAAENWTVEVASNTQNQPTPAREISTFTNVCQTRSVLLDLRQWIPVAVLSNGVIRSGEFHIEAPLLTWRNGNLTGNVLAAAGKGKEFPATVNVDLGGVVPHTIEIGSEPLQLRSEFRIWLEYPGLRIEGVTDWQTNKVVMSAHFGREGVLPETVSIKSEKLRIPGELLKLGEYQDVLGDLQANWTNGTFKLNVLADALPAAGATNFPPARLELKATGDTNAAVIESATITSPWVNAKLSEDVPVYFSWPIVRHPARLDVEVDLSGQPWTKLRGLMSGEITLNPTNAAYPLADFKLGGTNVGDSVVTARRVQLEGEFNWPWLSVTNASADLENGAMVSLDGGINWQSRQLSDTHVRFDGSVEHQWLPRGCAVDGLTLDLKASGPLTNLAHQGRLTVTNVVAARIRALQIDAAWDGIGLNLSHAAINARNGPDSVTAELSAHALNDLSRAELTLNQVDLRTNRQTAFRLERPATFVAEHVGDRTNDWRIKVSHLDLHGPAGGLALEAAVQWPQWGNLAFSVTNVHSGVLGRFFPLPPDSVRLDEMRAEGGWTNGPLHFDVRLQGVAQPAVFRLEATNQPGASNELFSPLTVQVDARGLSDGIIISNLTVSSEKSTVTSLRGFLPITLNPNTITQAMQVDVSKPVEIHLVTTPESIFWERLTDWTGVVLRQPDFKADVSGTWGRPEGTVRLRAAKVQYRKTEAKLPDMEGLQVDLDLTRNAAMLTNFSVLVQGQKVSGTAEVPLGEKFWTDWKQKKTPNWDQARGRLEIEHGSVAAFAGLFPTVLSPQGEFDLNVTMEQGLNLKGQLALQNARTRPLPGIGPIRDIEVRMFYANRTAKLQTASASIGGSKVMAAGEGDLSGTDWLKGVPPPFEFVLLGTNVPLSRQPGSIIRSDLNLAVKKTNGAPPLISGTAKLHDSYYLSDLADLVPGQAASPERRPPYFSVEDPGLADWRLGVRVTGEKSLKVRTTLFTGVVSPNLRLQGTLKEPAALGDVRIESGLVRFPFANLDVQQGMINLTSEDPYRPRLLVKAGTKQFGYEVRMELSGPADEPVIQFSSTPALSSEQLVLMVTAGELPRGGYTLNPEQRAETMALFLGKDMLAKLGFGDTSKERLTFSSGQEISEEGKPTYTLEYKLTDRWSVVGEYDRFNAFNAGVKWKVYSR